MENGDWRNVKPIGPKGGFAGLPYQGYGTSTTRAPQGSGCGTRSISSSKAGNDGTGKKAGFSRCAKLRPRWGGAVGLSAPGRGPDAVVRGRNIGAYVDSGTMVDTWGLMRRVLRARSARRSRLSGALALWRA